MAAPLAVDCAAGGAGHACGLRRVARRQPWAAVTPEATCCRRNAEPSLLFHDPGSCRSCSFSPPPLYPAALPSSAPAMHAVRSLDKLSRVSLVGDAAVALMTIAALALSGEAPKAVRPCSLSAAPNSGLHRCRSNSGAHGREGGCPQGTARLAAYQCWHMRVPLPCSRGGAGGQGARHPLAAQRRWVDDACRQQAGAECAANSAHVSPAVSKYVHSSVRRCLAGAAGPAMQ